LPRSPLRRVALGLAIALGVAPVVFFGVTLGIVKRTMAPEVPIGQLAGLVAEGIYSRVKCAIVTCTAETPEWLDYRLYAAPELLDGTLVALDVDEWGRVYVAETSRQERGAEDNRSHDWLAEDLASRSLEDRAAYYRAALDAGAFDDPDHFTTATDRLVLLEDGDGDGFADRRRELASWNEMLSGLVAGVEVREGTAWVTAVPSLHRLRDSDRDGVPDAPEELVRGFGVKTSLIGHDLHGLAWGPDGRLYFSMGDRGYSIERADGTRLEPDLGPGRGAVFRMWPDGSGLEVFATGLRNPQELAFDDFGNLFTGDNNGDGGDLARIVYVVEGGETGWAMPYQSLAGDYVRGPWVAERLWELQHDEQPAWVLPPVAHLGAGPAGLVHYPGLGLPERYADHFFLCDYRYMPDRSGVWSFALEPAGAGFELVDEHEFVWSILATDFDFSWDGRMFATEYNQTSGEVAVSVMRTRESAGEPRIAELTSHARTPMAELPSHDLLRLLDFPDQRLRLRAQSELAARAETSLLAALVHDRRAALRTRVHGLWGLGRIGAEGLRAVARDGLAWARPEPDELRAQLARVAGEVRAAWLAGDLRAWLTDPAPRVRFFAAQSLGALGDRASVPALLALLRDNADRDVFLRHAAVWALHRIDDREAVWAHRDDPSRSVRLAVLLVLRHAGDPRVAHFLADSDPRLVAEAARAIYDRAIEGAMPALAALLPGLAPADEADRQTARALHRRAIGASVRVRSAAGADGLARYAADERQLEALRELALEALATYAVPPPRDLAMGFHRPLVAVQEAVVAGVFRRRGRALVDSSLGGRALEIATALGEVPMEDRELAALAGDGDEPAAARASALRALAARVQGGAARPAAQASVDAALQSDTPALRMAGRELLEALDPDRAVGVLAEAASGAPVLGERQHAWARLGGLAPEAARAALSDALDRWERGALEEAVVLEVFAAARARDPALARRAAALLAPSADAPVASRRWALAGGDPEAGRVVFQTRGDCQRCHGGGGHGARVGPPLGGVAARGAEHVLRSLVEPDAELAAGFGTVAVTRRDGEIVSGRLLAASERQVEIERAGEVLRVPRADIVRMSEGASSMPPLGLVLEPEALRDVVAYVMSLPAGGTGGGS